MRKIWQLLLICVSIFMVPTVFAAHAVNEMSPVGYWKTIDDVTGQAKSIVHIWEEHNMLYGKVVKLFESAKKICDACQGEKHNQPILGMMVMSNFKQDKNNPQEWNGGKILDPKNGKIYNSLVQVEDNGQKLNVRGYVGVPLFGRSQTWLRVSGSGG